MDIYFAVYCQYCGCYEWSYVNDSPTECWIHDPVNHNTYTHTLSWYYQVGYSVPYEEVTAIGNAVAAWSCGDLRSDINQEYVDTYSGGSVWFTSFYLPLCSAWDGGLATSGGTGNFSWSALNGDFSSGNQNSPYGIVRASLLNGLEATLSIYNRGAITLTGWYRTPSRNEVNGGVFNSRHVHGRAADMKSAANPWTETEFNLLKDASLNTSPMPVEALNWNSYNDHHYHAAW